MWREERTLPTGHLWVAYRAGKGRHEKEGWSCIFLPAMFCSSELGGTEAWWFHTCIGLVWAVTHGGFATCPCGARWLDRPPSWLHSHSQVVGFLALWACRGIRSPNVSPVFTQRMSKTGVTDAQCYHWCYSTWVRSQVGWCVPLHRASREEDSLELESTRGRRLVLKISLSCPKRVAELLCQLRHTLFF